MVDENNLAQTFVEALEAHFRDDIAIVAKRLRSGLGSGPGDFFATGIAEFLAEYGGQSWAAGAGVGPALDPNEVLEGQELAAQRAKRRYRTQRPRPDSGADHIWRKPVLEPGDTRPMIHLTPAESSPGRGRVVARDPKTALLYASDIVLLDPLAHFAGTLGKLGYSPPRETIVSQGWIESIEWILRDRRRRLALAPNPAIRALREACGGISLEEWVVQIVEDYAELAPAVRSGLVDAVPIRYSPRHSLATGISESEAVALEEETGRRDHRHVQAMLQDVLLQAAVAGRAPGFVHAQARPGVAERVLVRYLVRTAELAEQQHAGASRVPGRDTVRRLLSLELPGVDFARVPDIVSLRDDSVFATVREDVRSALVASDEYSDMDSAQRAAAEVFGSRASGIRPRFTKTLSDAIIPMGVSYGIGSALGLQGGWQPMLPIFAAATASAASKARIKKALRAQRAVYMALAIRP